MSQVQKKLKARFKSRLREDADSLWIYFLSTVTLNLRVDTTNVNRIASSLMEKLGQCNEMFAKSQETKK